MNENPSTPQTITFVCSSCQKALRVNASIAGSAAKCPMCGSIEKVPERDSVSEAPVAGDQSPQVSSPPAISDQPVPIPAAADGLTAPGMQTAPDLPPPKTSAETASNSSPTPSAGIPKLSIQRDISSSENQTRTSQIFENLISEISKIYVGQDELVLGTLVALFSSGHVLIESVPGLGKTLFVRTLGRVLGCDFGRIQFTADLMPSDITGAPIFDMKNQEFRFRPGPVFTQLLLADEINRSPAKTHAALLETMQEYRVTVDGESHQLDRPFIVLATQNPIESEGTYNLPEAQLDRFMFKLIAEYPAESEEADILKLHSQQVDLSHRLETEVQKVVGPTEILEITEENSRINIEAKLLDYINKIVRLTREWPQFYMGASPRAGIALMQGSRTLAAFYGRDYVIPDDVVQIALPTLRHRVMLTAESDVEGHNVDDLLTEMIRTVEVPRL